MRELTDPEIHVMPGLHQMGTTPNRWSLCNSTVPCRTAPQLDLFPKTHAHPTYAHCPHLPPCFVAWQWLSCGKTGEQVRKVWICAMWDAGWSLNTFFYSGRISMDFNRVCGGVYTPVWKLLGGAWGFRRDSERAERAERVYYFGVQGGCDPGSPLCWGAWGYCSQRRWSRGGGGPRGTYNETAVSGVSLESCKNNITY